MDAFGINTVANAATGFQRRGGSIGFPNWRGMSNGTDAHAENCAKWAGEFSSFGNAN